MLYRTEICARRELNVRNSDVVQEVDPDWDGTSVEVVDTDSEKESVATVCFERAYAHLFGPPNDEAFSGHPLAERGR